MRRIGSELKRANGNKLDREISSVSVCMENWRQMRREGLKFVASATIASTTVANCFGFRDRKGERRVVLQVLRAAKFSLNLEKLVALRRKQAKT